ncbi:hypothetical protein [Streptomyces sp. NPDC005141]
MDNTLTTATFTLIGVLAGSAGTYFAPLQLDKRRQRSEQAVRHESQADVQLGRYVSARTTVDVWIDLLDRAYEDLRHDCFDREAFTADSIRYSDQLRAELADLTFLGVPVRSGIHAVGSADIIHSLAAVSSAVKHIQHARGTSRPRLMEAIRGQIRTCRDERNAWSLRVLDTVARLPGARLGSIELDGTPVRGQLPGRRP